jgi:hypothetical protein
VSGPRKPRTDEQRADDRERARERRGGPHDATERDALRDAYATITRRDATIGELLTHLAALHNRARASELSGSASASSPPSANAKKPNGVLASGLGSYATAAAVFPHPSEQNDAVLGYSSTVDTNGVHDATRDATRDATEFEALRDAYTQYSIISRDPPRSSAEHDERRATGRRELEEFLNLQNGEKKP